MHDLTLCNTLLPLQDSFWTFCTKRWAEQVINAHNIDDAAHEAAAAYIAGLNANGDQA